MNYNKAIKSLLKIFSMKLSITFLNMLLVVLYSSCMQAQQNNKSNSEMKVLTPKAFLEAYKNDKGAQLIDVRTKTEFNKGHLADSKNMNIYAEDFNVQLKTLDKQKPVYVYCHSGGRSAECATILKQMGFAKVIDMSGGFSTWQKEGLPYEQ